LTLYSFYFTFFFLIIVNIILPLIFNSHCFLSL
jgi:hypothetical protein